MSLFFYRLGTSLSFALHLFVEIRSSGVEHIPKRGAGLLASNHISHFDPVLIALKSNRDIDYMASAEFFAHPFTRIAMKSLNAFPIDRTRRDIAAVKVAIERLKEDKIVGIFPEGGIRQGERSLLNGAIIGDGTTALARSLDVPMIPMAIIGSDQLYQWRSWFRRSRVFIRFGPPIIPKPEESRRDLATRLSTAIRDLADDLRREYKITPAEWPHSAQERWKMG